MGLSEQVAVKKKEEEKVYVDFQVCSLCGGWWQKFIISKGELWNPTARVWHQVTFALVFQSVK